MAHAMMGGDGDVSEFANIMKSHKRVPTQMHIQRLARNRPQPPPQAPRRLMPRRPPGQKMPQPHHAHRPPHPSQMSGGVVGSGVRGPPVQRGSRPMHMPGRAYGPPPPPPPAPTHQPQRQMGRQYGRQAPTPPPPPHNRRGPSQPMPHRNRDLHNLEPPLSARSNRARSILNQRNGGTADGMPQRIQPLSNMPMQRNMHSQQQQQQQREPSEAAFSIRTATDDDDDTASSIFPGQSLVYEKRPDESLFSGIDEQASPHVVGNAQAGTSASPGAVDAFAARRKRPDVFGVLDSSDEEDASESYDSDEDMDYERTRRRGGGGKDNNRQSRNSSRRSRRSRRSGSKRHTPVRRGMRGKSASRSLDIDPTTGLRRTKHATPSHMRELLSLLRDVDMPESTKSILRRDMMERIREHDAHGSALPEHAYANGNRTLPDTELELFKMEAKQQRHGDKTKLKHMLNFAASGLHGVCHLLNVNWLKTQKLPYAIREALEDQEFDEAFAHVGHYLSGTVYDNPLFTIAVKFLSIVSQAHHEATLDEIHEKEAEHKRREAETKRNASEQIRHLRQVANMASNAPVRSDDAPKTQQTPQPALDLPPPPSPASLKSALNPSASTHTNMGTGKRGRESSVNRLQRFQKLNAVRNDAARDLSESSPMPERSAETLQQIYDEDSSDGIDESDTEVEDSNNNNAAGEDDNDDDDDDDAFDFGGGGDSDDSGGSDRGSDRTGSSTSPIHKSRVEQRQPQQRGTTRQPFALVGADTAANSEAMERMAKALNGPLKAAAQMM